MDRTDPGESYYAEVESYFVAKRGSPLFITPAEWDLVLRWERLGIPLPVLKQGIDRALERPKARLRPRKLGYCRQSVEAAFRRFRESALGARRAVEGEGEEEGADCASHLRALSTGLRELASGWASRSASFAETLAGAAELTERLSREVELAPDRLSEIESELAAADDRILKGSELVLGEELPEALRAQAASLLESYRERMPPKVYEAALESAFRRRIRAKLELPTLSLYTR